MYLITNKCTIDTESFSLNMTQKKEKKKNRLRNSQGSRSPTGGTKTRSCQCIPDGEIPEMCVGVGILEEWRRYDPIPPLKMPAKPQSSCVRISVSFHKIVFHSIS